MAWLKAFFKKEPVFVLALLAAVLSMAAGAPLSAYPGYIDWSVLMLLFCLMSVVAGLDGAGLFEKAASFLPSKFTTRRTMMLALMGVCFFGAMAFTNDVALIAFVPLALLLFRPEHGYARILAVCGMAVAANLGSLVTPVGNPQNLFLYTYYQMTPAGFFSVTLPLGGVCLVLTAALCLLMPNQPIERTNRSASPIRKGMAIRYALLFVLCLCTVFGLVPHWLCFAVVLASLILLDRERLKKVDWFLLATFVCFFVFSGNLASIGAVRETLGGLLRGRECLVSALCAQCISNVPAAVLLAPFTDQARGLLLGVNIGGLGTPVASLASLIAYKLYAHAPGAKSGKFMLIFLAMNLVLLAVLLLIFA